MARPRKSDTDEPEVEGVASTEEIEKRVEEEQKARVEQVGQSQFFKPMAVLASADEHIDMGFAPVYARPYGSLPKLVDPATGRPPLVKASELEDKKKEIAAAHRKLQPVPTPEEGEKPGEGMVELRM